MTNLFIWMEQKKTIILFDPIYQNKWIRLSIALMILQCSAHFNIVHHYQNNQNNLLGTVPSDIFQKKSFLFLLFPY